MSDSEQVTRLVLVRHGHVPGISPPQFRGRAELELTDEGILGAARAGKWIARNWKPSIVLTSPLKRCIDTGAAIAKACHVPAEVLPSLHDLDYGDWQGCSHAQIESDAPALYKLWQTRPQWVRFPHGESLQDLVARVADAVRFVLEQHRSQTVVMVGHDSVNRALLMQCLDQPLSAYRSVAQDPCAISEIEITDSTVQVMRINETAHLRPNAGQLL